MKPLVAIFAHPDDEAFGPSGSLATFAKKQDVYIICVTKGDAGQNSGDVTDNLAAVRRAELEKSAAIIGVKKVFFLDYGDGTLCNQLYHEIADKLETMLTEIEPETLLTYELKGISGHIDHIAVALITSFLFKKLPFVHTLFYYVELKELIAPIAKNYFIYMPEGYDKSQVDLTINTESVWEQKLAAIHAHASQKHDAEMIIENLQKFPKEEHFLVKVKI